eukprot:scaffold32489_cov63-Phaeocystis_antarctica.AAC.4
MQTEDLKSRIPYIHHVCGEAAERGDQRSIALPRGGAGNAGDRQGGRSVSGLDGRFTRRAPSAHLQTGVQRARSGPRRGLEQRQPRTLGSDAGGAEAAEG